MKRLLIVEDEPRTRDSLRNLIDWKAIGIDEVTVAGSGDEGPAAARSSKPNVIIADVRMPGFDGIEMSERIMRTSPISRVIILSAYDETTYFQRAIRAGVVDYLLKPVDPRKITRAVIRALEEEADLEWQRRGEFRLKTLLRSNRAVLEQSFVERLVDAYAQAPPTAEELVTLRPSIALPPHGPFVGMVGRVVDENDSWPTSLAATVNAFAKRHAGTTQRAPAVLSSPISGTFVIITAIDPSNGRAPSSNDADQAGVTAELAALLSSSLQCDVHATLPARTLDDLVAAVFAFRHVLSVSGTAGARGKREGGIVANVAKVVDEYLADERLTVKFIADRLHFTSAYICMAFKKQHGITVNDYINLSRLEEARRLIRDSDLKLYEIAEESGFRSGSYFARVFRKYLAMSPREYRDQYVDPGG